jgi:hypothetical protein
MSAQYPPNWKQIAYQAKVDAHWQCQTCGKQCRWPRESLAEFIARTGYDLAQVEAHPRRWRLTVAHLNHDPENLEAQLAVLCVPCHRGYDNRQMPRIKHQYQERLGQLRLEEAPQAALEGTQLALDVLAIPFEVANPQAGVERVTVATLEDWLQRHLANLASDTDPKALLKSIVGNSEAHSKNLAALARWVPYQGRYRREDLKQACEGVLARLCLQQKPKSLRLSTQRRFSHKGFASGWLEERQGNKQRQTPTTSYYYCWETQTGCQKLYVPMGKVWRCDQMIQGRKSVDEILAFLAKKSATSKQRKSDEQASLLA